VWQGWQEWSDQLRRQLNCFALFGKLPYNVCQYFATMELTVLNNKVKTAYIVIIQGLGLSKMTSAHGVNRQSFRQV